MRNEKRRVWWFGLINLVSGAVVVGSLALVFSPIGLQKGYVGHVLTELKQDLS